MQQKEKKYNKDNKHQESLNSKYSAYSKDKVLFKNKNFKQFKNKHVSFDKYDSEKNKRGYSNSFLQLTKNLLKERKFLKKVYTSFPVPQAEEANKYFRAKALFSKYKKLNKTKFYNRIYLFKSIRLRAYLAALRVQFISGLKSSKKKMVYFLTRAILKPLKWKLEYRIFKTLYNKKLKNLLLLKKKIKSKTKNKLFPSYINGFLESKSTSTLFPSQETGISIFLKNLLKEHNLKEGAIKFTRIGKPILSNSLLNKIWTHVKRYTPYHYRKNPQITDLIFGAAWLIQGNREGSESLFNQLLVAYFQRLPKSRHRKFFLFLKDFFRTVLVVKPNLNFNIGQLNSSRVKGIKLEVSGRLKGKPRASSETVSIGSVPTQTIALDVKFSSLTAFTNMGTFGFKLWVVYRPLEKIKKKKFFKFSAKESLKKLLLLSQKPKISQKNTESYVDHRFKAKKQNFQKNHKPYKSTEKKVDNLTNNSFQKREKLNSPIKNKNVIITKKI
jgi:hypothetical protein